MSWFLLQYYVVVVVLAMDNVAMPFLLGRGPRGPPPIALHNVVAVLSWYQSIKNCRGTVKHTREA